MTRFYYEWDYSNKKMRQFERSGECNQCGQCCQALIRYALAGVLGDHPDAGGNVGTGTDETGVWHEVYDDELDRRWFIRDIEILPGEHTCRQLTEVKGCHLHAEKNVQSGHLALCAIWPMGPEHVISFDQCSYSFRQIAEWDFDELP